MPLTGQPNRPPKAKSTVGLILRFVLYALALVLLWLYTVEYELLPLGIIAFVGLIGVYPLTYVAYLGFVAGAQRKRLQDDFRLLGLAREEDLEETVEKLYQTTYSPIQFTIYISLIILESLLIFWAYLSCKPATTAALCFGFIAPVTMALVFYSFVGAYVFSVQELIRRYNTLDLQPQVYSSILMRFLIAAAITFAGASIILLGAGQALPAEAAENPEAWAALVAFAIGVFPTQGLRWLLKQANRVLNPDAAPANELPMKNLLGMSSWHEARLNQMGIDDVQNLATVDIRKLLLTTRFDTQEIIHWIDQAILYVKAGGKIERFREARITSFHELRRVLDQLSLNFPLQADAAEREQRSQARERLALALGMADADELDRLGDHSNFPNYAHISEYYTRTARVARQRATRGMEVVTGAFYETDYQRAVADGERLRAQNPDDPELLNALGSAYYQLGRLEEAREAFDRAIELDERMVEAYYGRSLVYLENGDYRGAIRDCTLAIGMDRTHANAFNNRGLAYTQLGYLDRAMEDLNEALRLDDRLARAYLNRGLSQNALNAFLPALGDFEKAYLLGERVGELWLGWGIALLGAGDYQGAVDKLSQAVLYDTNLASAYLQRGYAYLELGYYRQARTDLETALREAPDLWAAHHQLGLLEARQNRYPAAIEHYQQALAIDPEQFVTHYNLAIAYYKLDRMAESRQAFQRVIELAPEDTLEAREARTQLARLSDTLAQADPQETPGES